MALVYEYTPAVPDASPAGTPFDTTRTGVTQRSQAANIEGVWDAMRTALLAAGWTENNLATRDSVFFSSGESGNELIPIRIVLSTGSTDYVHFQIGTKLDAANALQGEIGFTSGASGNVFDRWSVTGTLAGFEFQIVANLDFLWVFAQATNGTGSIYSAFVGSLSRVGVQANPNFYTGVGAISSGQFVTVTLGGGADPQADGYTVGDTCQLIEAAAASPAAAERALIVDVTSTSLTFANLANSYTSARIGQLASPLFRWVGSNVSPTASNSWSSPFTWETLTDNDLANASDQSGSVQVFRAAPVLSSGLLAPAQVTTDEYGFNALPNQQNERFSARAMVMVGPNNSNGGQYGRIPGIYQLWRFSVTPQLYPHDWYEDDRESPVIQATPQRFQSNLVNAFYALGPLPL